MKPERTTAHSEFLPLASVFIRPVAYAFKNAATLAATWQSLNYLSEPDFEAAVAQYRKFRELLEATGDEVLPMPPSEGLSPDSLYCRDAAIATDHGMILCRMGKVARQGEPQFHNAFYESLGIPVLGRIEAPGTLEGGDVAWLDEHTLAVGHTYRTNASGIEQLRALLNPFDITVIPVDLPHFRGPSDVFHLMSI